MRYYLVAGEASGDLHASHLMASLKEADKEAEFRFVGGEMMCAVACDGTDNRAAGLVYHYRDLAYMGIVPVVMHLRVILRAMKTVRRDVLDWRPDALILIDYPGFNMQLAEYVHSHSNIPTFYYIAPKIWAWKEYRIRSIRKNVDHLLSILPFEVDYFEKRHHYPITYVGNPTMDEVAEYISTHPRDKKAFCRRHSIPEGKPMIALLAGSRKQEIGDNLSVMLRAVEPYMSTHNVVVAAAPGIEDDVYERLVSPPFIVRNATYSLLQHSDAALVTSGTATLETALFRVPQVVCYNLPRWYGWLRPLVLKVPYVSLVNLIAGREIVPELIAGKMTVRNVRRHLDAILNNPADQLAGYEEVAARLGEKGSPRRAACAIIEAVQ